jgi:hypothetical protein
VSSQRPPVAMRRQRTDTRRVRLLFEIDLNRIDGPDAAADRVWELTGREVQRALDARGGRHDDLPAADQPGPGGPAAPAD